MSSDNRRLQIIQAAERLFTSRRFHEVTTDDIAHLAKVGKGTIYRYFQDKDDLFYHTATWGFDELCQTLSDGASNGGGFAEQLMDACRQISEFFHRRRQFMRLAQSDDGGMDIRGELRQRWAAHRGRLVQAVSQIVARGVEEGQIRKDVPPQALATFLLGMLRTRARDLADLPEDTKKIQTVVHLFCHGACLTS